MPKVTVYLKNTVIDEIKSLVEEDIQAGAHPEEVSFSSKTSMLLELGLRVYNLRRSEHVSGGRDDFEKLLITAALEAKYLTQHLTKTISELHGVDVSAVKEKVKKTIEADIEPFFPNIEE
jgi:cell division protein FtsX